MPVAACNKSVEIFDDPYVLKLSVKYLFKLSNLPSASSESIDEYFSLADFINILAIIAPFVYEGNQLKLNLKPLLSKEFFNKGTVEFVFLGQTKVVYINNSNSNTFDPEFRVSKYELDGEVMSEVVGENAIKVRDGLIKEIRVYF